MNTHRFLIVAMTAVAALALSVSCKKDDAQPAKANLTLHIEHYVDKVPLQFDTTTYVNEAGYNYSVEKVHYYLSDFTFTRGEEIAYYDNVFYIDARQSGTLTLTLENLPTGKYDKVSFNIGLNSTVNVTNGLPPTMENLNMEWPVPMGGGYHFLKFEGRYLSNSLLTGFAMHLGRNENLVQVSLDNLDFDVSKKSVYAVLNMNLNEWFRNPHLYDFETDGNYSMGSMAAMTKLTANGKEVFTFSKE